VLCIRTIHHVCSRAQMQSSHLLVQLVYDCIQLTCYKLKVILDCMLMLCFQLLGHPHTSSPGDLMQRLAWAIFMIESSVADPRRCRLQYSIT
jgi:hypothetical protein